ncbi:MAG TPA: YhzD family protein [Bacillota bacterium]|nr:YhzD family protein [Bacillota bacterium]
MKTYFLTAFDPTGEKLLDETFEAEDHDAAKTIGMEKLTEEGYSEHTHRCVSPDAELVLFHR